MEGRPDALQPLHFDQCKEFQAIQHGLPSKTLRCSDNTRRLLGFSFFRRLRQILAITVVSHGTGGFSPVGTTMLQRYRPHGLPSFLVSPKWLVGDVWGFRISTCLFIGACPILLSRGQVLVHHLFFLLMSQQLLFFSAFFFYDTPSVFTYAVIRGACKNNVLIPCLLNIRRQVKQGEEEEGDDDEEGRKGGKEKLDSESASTPSLGRRIGKLRQ